MNQLQLFLFLSSIWASGNFTKPLQKKSDGHNVQSNFTDFSTYISIFQIQSKQLPIKILQFYDIPYHLTAIPQPNPKEILRNFRYSEFWTFLQNSHLPITNSTYTGNNKTSSQTIIHTQLKYIVRNHSVIQPFSIPTYHEYFMTLSNASIFLRTMISNNNTTTIAMELSQNLTNTKRSREDDASNEDPEDSNPTDNIQINSANGTTQCVVPNTATEYIMTSEEPDPKDLNTSSQTHILSATNDLNNTGNPDTQSHFHSVATMLEVTDPYRSYLVALPEQCDFSGHVNLLPDSVNSLCNARTERFPATSLARNYFDEWIRSLPGPNDRPITDLQVPVFLHFLSILHSETQVYIKSAIQEDLSVVQSSIPGKSSALIQSVKTFYADWAATQATLVNDTLLPQMLSTLPPAWHETATRDWQSDMNSGELILLDLIYQQHGYDPSATLTTCSDTPVWCDTAVAPRPSETIKKQKPTPRTLTPRFSPSGKASRPPPPTLAEIVQTPMPNPAAKPSLLTQAEQAVLCLRPDGTRHDHPFSTNPDHEQLADRLAHIDGKILLAGYIVVHNFTPSTSVEATIRTLEKIVKLIGSDTDGGLRIDENYVRRMHSYNHWVLLRHSEELHPPGHIIKLSDIARFGTIYVEGKNNYTHLRIYPTVSMVQTPYPHIIYPIPIGTDLHKLQAVTKYPPLAAFRRFSLHKDKDAILSAQFLAIYDRLDSNMKKQGSFALILIPQFTDTIPTVIKQPKRVDAVHYDHPNTDPSKERTQVMELVLEVVFLLTEDDISDGTLSPTYQLVREKIIDQITQQAAPGTVPHPILHLVHVSGFVFEMANSFTDFVHHGRRHPQTVARQISTIYNVPPGVLARDMLIILQRSPINCNLLADVDLVFTLPKVDRARGVPWRLAFLAPTTTYLDLSPLADYWDHSGSEPDNRPTNKIIWIPGEELFFGLQQMHEAEWAQSQARTPPMETRVDKNLPYPDRQQRNPMRSFGTPSTRGGIGGRGGRAGRSQVTATSSSRPITLATRQADATALPMPHPPWNGRDGQESPSTDPPRPLTRRVTTGTSTVFLSSTPSPSVVLSSLQVALAKHTTDTRPCGDTAGDTAMIPRPKDTASNITSSGTESALVPHGMGTVSNIITPDATALILQMIRDVHLEHQAEQINTIQETARRTALLEETMARVCKQQTDLNQAQTISLQSTTAFQIQQRLETFHLSAQQLKKQVIAVSREERSLSILTDPAARAFLQAEIADQLQDNARERARLLSVLTNIRDEAILQGHDPIYLNIPSDF